jgi:hypothetical protein
VTDDPWTWTEMFSRTDQTRRAYRLSGDAAKSETAAAETLPSCPPSAVHDMILPWAEVCAGDLVLLNDELTVAERVEVYEDDWQGTKWLRADISYRQDGRLFTTDQHGDRLTAVRRYDTEEG